MQRVPWRRSCGRQLAVGERTATNGRGAISAARSAVQRSNSAARLSAAARQGSSPKGRDTRSGARFTTSPAPAKPGRRPAFQRLRRPAPGLSCGMRRPTIDRGYRWMHCRSGAQARTSAGSTRGPNLSLQILDVEVGGTERGIRSGLLRESIRVGEVVDGIVGRRSGSRRQRRRRRAGVARQLRVARGG